MNPKSVAPKPTDVAVTAPPGPRMVVVQPGDLQWKPKTALPPGAVGAKLWGDPETGPYGLTARFPANFRVPLHWHSNDVRVVMLQGSLVISYPGEPAVEIREGGYFLLPARRAYAAACAQPCQWMAFDQLPFDIIYSDPKDDPRAEAA